MFAQGCWLKYLGVELKLLAGLAVRKAGYGVGREEERTNLNPQVQLNPYVSLIPSTSKTQFPQHKDAHISGSRGRRQDPMGAGGSKNSAVTPCQQVSGRSATTCMSSAWTSWAYLLLFWFYLSILMLIFLIVHPNPQPCQEGNTGTTDPV